AAGLSFFGGVWLARRLFPTADTAGQPPLPMSEERRAKARARATLLSAALALHQLFSRTILPLSGFNSQNDTNTVPQRISEASAGVWHFLLVLFGAFCLFRLCTVLRGLRMNEASAAPDYRIRVVNFLTMVGRVIALATPVLVALGYVTAGNAMLWALVRTLALVGLLIILQDFIADF